MLALLTLGTLVAAPVLLWRKWRRFARRRDAYEWDMARWNCRWVAGPSTVNCQLSTVSITFVAMGFAETRLAARLTDALRLARPGLRVTWTIRNIPAAHIGGAIPDGQAVCPMPFDWLIPAGNWMKTVRPDVVVLVERFWFPFLVRGAKSRGARLAVVGGSTRSHDKGRYKTSAFFYRWMLGAFDVLCLRSPEQLARLQTVLPPSVDARVTGSLKFPLAAPTLDAERAASLEAWLSQVGDVPLLICGSTQPGDEAWLLDAWQQARAQTPCALLLAPRNTPRVDEVAALCESRGLSVSRRSQRPEVGKQRLEVAISALEVASGKLKDATPSREVANGKSEVANGKHEVTTEKDEVAERMTNTVLLLDTIGELAWVYKWAKAAFVGGTISSTGHNVTEPLVWGVPVFYGPKRGTFEAEQRACEEAGVGFRVSTPDELAEGWTRVLSDESWRDELSGRALAAVAEGQKAFDLTLSALLEVVDAVKKVPSAQ